MHLQVHVRKGRPLERVLFQAAEVVITAAAVCMITIASNHVRHRGATQVVSKEEEEDQAGATAAEQQS